MFGSNSAGDNSFCAKRQPFDIVTGPLTVKTIALASSSTKHNEGVNTTLKRNIPFCETNISTLELYTWVFVSKNDIEMGQMAIT